MPLPSAPKKLGDRVKKTEFGLKKTQTAKKPPVNILEPTDRVIDIPADVVTEAPAGSATKATSAQKTVPAKAKTKSKATAPEVKETKPVEIPSNKEGLAEVSEILAANLGASRLRSPRGTAAALKPRLFVLDTNVLLHDPTCLFRFQEHDVFLPMMTLEELDNHKTGTSDISRNARQVTRTIDQLVEAGTDSIEKGVNLNALGNIEAHGKLFFETKALSGELPESLPKNKADNIIIAVVKALVPLHPDKSVVLVSKDINMRIKATALGLDAEDYFNDKTIDDTDLLYAGRTVVDNVFWEKDVENLKSWIVDGRTWYSFTGPLAQKLTRNEFVATADGGFAAQVKSVENGTATLATIKDYVQPRNGVWGICARNLEQSMALNLLMDPEIDFVTLLGQAGTGKTLITLAAALTQTLDERRFSEIIFTRATVSVGEEIGFLPGTEEEKMTPWMGALEDNLEVLNKSDRSTGDWGRSAAADLIRSRIRIKSMSFMRGRTFLNKFVIIDEAQNLSPKQMKTLISRAGPGTKIVCMGNIAQIDTPYLTEGSSGLTYVVERFRGWEHAGHITLQRGERSRLADYANEVL